MSWDRLESIATAFGRKRGQTLRAIDSLSLRRLDEWQHTCTTTYGQFRIPSSPSVFPCVKTHSEWSWLQRVWQRLFSCVPIFPLTQDMVFIDFRSIFFSQAVSLPEKKLTSMSSNELFSSALNWKSKVVEMHLNEDLGAFRKTLSESANVPPHLLLPTQIKGTNLLAWSSTAKSLKDHESHLNWTAVAKIFLY